jgi:acyl-CoA synthetase (AMP-forming)/AMP-acid ligase II
MHTPYGATECLPVSTIEATTILGETAARTDRGAGVCVGQKFDSVDWRIIRITDEPILSIDDAEELPKGEVGELIVRGPQVSPRYVTQLKFNIEAKINSKRAGRSPAPHGGEDAPAHGDRSLETLPWHRTGDVGYLDTQNRFWYCGRKSQRVETSLGPMYTEAYEAIFNKHPQVRRSALVGVGPRGKQRPVMILECTSQISDQDVEALKQETEGGPGVPDGAIFTVDWPLPFDIRHNAKINREKLAQWAATQLSL